MVLHHSCTQGSEEPVPIQSPSGKKAFKDSNGTDLGWAFIEKLYDKLQALNKESGGDVTNGVRLNATKATR